MDTISGILDFGVLNLVVFLGFCSSDVFIWGGELNP